MDLQPAAHHLNAPGVLGGRAYSAAGVWVGVRTPERFPAAPGLLASGQNATGAVWLRSAAHGGPDIDAALLEAREALRRELFGAAPLQVRR